jgi:protease YdgD
MFVKLFRCLLTAAAIGSFGCVSAFADAIKLSSQNGETVDVTSYPWSSIGKLFNEAGGTCSGVVIAPDKVLTAAHCVYNPRQRRFLPASLVHFLLGYEGGRSTVHARVARYEIGAGYDPQVWFGTLESDWAILTLTQTLPAEIIPLKLLTQRYPSGIKAAIAGYGQDRAHVMTADRHCELRERGQGGWLYHTCRGVKGYSGAPILVSTAEDEFSIAGIHVAMMGRKDALRNIAVEAEVIVRESQPKVMAALPFDSGWFE